MLGDRHGATLLHLAIQASDPSPQLAALTAQRTAREQALAHHTSRREAAGGEMVLHDGGIEDRKGLLAAALPRADFVVFPVDCADHDSMATFKPVCERHGVPFHAVRSASVASFTALLASLAGPITDTGVAPASRLCLRHG